MSTRTIGVTYAMLIVAIGAVAALVAIVYVMKPQGPIESTPPPAAPVVPTIKPTASAAAGPMTFRDPENTQRYLALQTAVPLLRTKLAALAETKVLPGDDLEASCADIFKLANPLAGEPHPEVQKAAEGAKRMCDYDRPLTTLRVALRALQTGGANKKTICNAVGRWTGQLLDKKYGDDEQVKLQLAEVGKACL